MGPQHSTRRSSVTKHPTSWYRRWVTFTACPPWPQPGLLEKKAAAPPWSTGHLLLSALINGQRSPGRTKPSAVPWSAPQPHSTYSTMGPVPRKWRDGEGSMEDGGCQRHWWWRGAACWHLLPPPPAPRLLFGDWFVATCQDGEQKAAG